MELRNSVLILLYDLNVIDENDLTGDRGSEIMEDSGILNIGGIDIPQSQRAEMTRDTYYYDATNRKWRPLK